MTLIQEKIILYLQYHKWGYWDGWEELIDYVIEETGQDLPLWNEMQQLKKNGYVIALPVFLDDGKLNGKGWFLTDKGMNLKKEKGDT